MASVVWDILWLVSVYSCPVSTVIRLRLFWPPSVVGDIVVWLVSIYSCPVSTVIRLRLFWPPSVVGDIVVGWSLSIVALL